jgi:threonine synthase
VIPAVSRLVCAGCGAEPAPDDPYPFGCSNAAHGDDIDHVIRRDLDLSRVRFPWGDSEPNPFVRYRQLLHSYHVARDGGTSDDEFCALVRGLDERVSAVDGHGFAVTPFRRSDELSERLDFSDAGGVFLKDETGNVSGSHKARHLFGVLLYLEVVEQLGRTSRAERRELAIASCGNAALAAAVVAAAGGRRLRVFVPVDANQVVLERLEALGAEVEVCARTEGVSGDPTVHRLREALAEGALPFTCQGNLNGLAVEGGQTLAWELASSGVSLDRLIVQVGGGALASACGTGLREATGLGAPGKQPRLDTVQTEAAWPLRRAYDRLLALGGSAALGYAARHRSEFMWPWESEPHSVAHGILDDETYDWLAVVDAMLATGGRPYVVDEGRLVQAHELAVEATGIDVDPTGSSGLAGLLALRASGEVGEDERVGLLFTGITRTREIERKGVEDEELSGTRHPVAQGLRTD